MNAAADTQSRTTDAVTPAGQYRYIVTSVQAMTYRDIGTAVFALRTASRIETWVPADKTMTWMSRETQSGGGAWLIGTEERARRHGVTTPRPSRVDRHRRCGVWSPQPGEDPCARPGTWQEPNEAFLNALPRDPQALLGMLRADTAGRGNNRDQEVLVYAADALRTGLIPADLRAALYRTLALLPSLTVTERTTTLDGHPGTALGITAADEQQEIIISPDTGAFIGERTRLATDRNGIPAGTVIGSSSVSYGIARKAGERPAR